MAHGTGAAPCKRQNSGHNSLHLPISHMMPFPFQPEEPPAPAPNLPMAHEHSQGMAGRSQLRSSGPKIEVPMGEALSSWCIEAWGQCGDILKVWWHPHLEIFSLVFLFHQQIFSCLNPARIYPPQTLGPAHMTLAAEHILLSVSSSWHAQLMSVKRTIHLFPSGT